MGVDQSIAGPIAFARRSHSRRRRGKRGGSGDVAAQHDTATEKDQEDDTSVQQKSNADLSSEHTNTFCHRQQTEFASSAPSAQPKLLSHAASATVFVQMQVAENDDDQ